MEELYKGVVNRSMTNIQLLEEALHQISSVRNELKNNCAEVKGEIQMAFSNQLDSLRSREVFLLSQVDVIKATKDYILQGQEEQLNRALGNLQCILSTFGDGKNTHPTNTANKLDEIIVRLQNINLLPKIHSDVQFQVCSKSMRDAIHAFGRIDPLGISNEPKAFSPDEPPSASLPRVFEDYEDPEHHVFYKTLSRIYNGNGSSSTVEVKTPPLYQPVADWLLKTPETPQQKAVCPTVFPPFMSSATNAQDSTAQWLLNMKHAVEVEDDSCQLQNGRHRFTSSSEASDFVVLNVQEHNNLFEVFKTKVDDITQWLKPHPVTDVKPDEECGTDNTHPFQVSIDLNAWLCKEKFKNGDINCHKQKICQPSNGEEMDIENLHQLLCVDMASRYSKWLLHAVDKGKAAESENANPFQCQQDYSLWLKKQSSEKEIDESQANCCSNGNAVKTVCRANELCESFSECVCDENCCHAISREESMQFVCDPTCIPTFDYFQKLTNNKDDWLLAKLNEDSDCEMYCSNDNTAISEQWLSHETESTRYMDEKVEVDKESSYNCSTAGSMENWLSPKAVDAELVKEKYVSEWLFTKIAPQISEKNTCYSKVSLEKWLLNSEKNVLTEQSGWDKKMEVEEEDYVWLQKKEGSTEKLDKLKGAL